MGILQERPSGPLPRAIESTFARACRLFPVVVVTGARRTGKSSLVRSVGDATSRGYFTLDSAESRTLAAREPRAFVTQAERLTIDEVQRLPDLLLSIKEAVDHDPTP